MSAHLWLLRAPHSDSVLCYQTRASEKRQWPFEITMPNGKPKQYSDPLPWYVAVTTCLHSCSFTADSLYWKIPHQASCGCTSGIPVGFFQELWKVDSRRRIESNYMAISVFGFCGSRLPSLTWPLLLIVLSLAMHFISALMVVSSPMMSRPRVLSMSCSLTSPASCSV